MVSRKEFSGPIIILFILVLTIAALALTGASSRSYLPRRAVYSVHTNVEALELWRTLGLDGRILIYFDNGLNLDDDFYQSLNIRFAAMDRLLPPADSRNFLTLALYHGMFRKVCHVVPDSSWPEIRQKLSVYPFISDNGREFRYTIEGIPVIVARLKDVPSFSEKATVYVNSSYMRAHSDTGVKAFMENSRIADLVVIRRDSE